MWLMWLALSTAPAFATDEPEQSPEEEVPSAADDATEPDPPPLPPPPVLSPDALVPGDGQALPVVELEEAPDAPTERDSPQLGEATLTPPLPPLDAPTPPPARRNNLLRRRVEPVIDGEKQLLKGSERGKFLPMSRSQHRWLKPSRWHLPPNPRGQTDYTAYTLEFGEIKVGVSSITVGVLPRVQLGTMPVLDALGIYNIKGKVNLFRVKGVDGSLTGHYHVLPLGPFKGTYLGLGAHGSIIINRHWSIHGAGSYANMGARGVPDLSAVSPLITGFTGDLGQYNPPKEWFGDDPPTVRAEALTIKVATDVRLNRRDSLVLQGQTMLRAAVVTELPEDLPIAEALPPIAGLNEALSYEGSFKIREAYTLSLSYQATWKQVDLRLGVGMSSVPYAWLLQSTELSYRFGGRTRRTEHRQRRTWRRNKRDVGPSRKATPPAAPPPPAAPSDPT